MKYYRNVDK